MASSSDAAPRAALVLYGRVGTYLVRTQSLKMGQHGDPELWARAAASIKQHVVDPWRRAGGVDVFVQSWNPELTAQMREFWQPAAVDHAEQVDDGSMIPRHCPVRLRYCERTMWALLGMKRGLALRARYAAQRVEPLDVVAHHEDGGVRVRAAPLRRVARAQRESALHPEQCPHRPLAVP